MQQGIGEKIFKRQKARLSLSFNDYGILCYLGSPFVDAHW